MKFLYYIQQLKAIGEGSYLLFYYKKFKATIRQLWKQVYGLDISGIQEYLIPRVRYWGWKSSLVIVLCYVFLYFLNCSLGLFNCCFYLLHELVYHFQSRGTLPRFKAYMESLSSIKQEQSLLGRGMHIVVILKFCYQQQVIPVILLLIDK